MFSTNAYKNTFTVDLRISIAFYGASEWAVQDFTKEGILLPEYPARRISLLGAGVPLENPVEDGALSQALRIDLLHGNIVTPAATAIPPVTSVGCGGGDGGGGATANDGTVVSFGYVGSSSSSVVANDLVQVGNDGVGWVVREGWKCGQNVDTFFT